MHHHDKRHPTPRSARPNHQPSQTVQTQAHAAHLRLQQRRRLHHREAQVGNGSGRWRRRPRSHRQIDHHGLPALLPSLWGSRGQKDEVLSCRHAHGPVQDKLPVATGDGTPRRGPDCLPYLTALLLHDRGLLPVWCTRS